MEFRSLLSKILLLVSVFAAAAVNYGCSGCGKGTSAEVSSNDGSSGGGGGGSSGSGGGSSDTTAPTAPSIVINSAAADTAFRDVTLTLSATEAVSLPMEMCISESAVCAACSYVAYNTTQAFNVSAGVGVKTIGVKFRDAALNETACVTDTINLIAAPVITVDPRFAAASNWNQYIRRCVGGTNDCSGITDGANACTGAESGGATACIHGGDRKKVVTVEGTCTGLTMTDNLGVFDWTCSIVGGFATFYSKIKDSKGLADLVTHADPVGSWKNNFVTLDNNGSTITSANTTWWTNLIRAMPNNAAACAADGDPSGPAWTCPGTQNIATLDRANTIFTLNAARATRGYNIGGDGIALVTMGNATILSAAVSGNNCKSYWWSTVNQFEVGTDTTCMVATGGQKFLWIEGNYMGDDTSGGTPDILVGLADTVFSQIRRASFSFGGTGSLYLDNGFSYNRVSQTRTNGGSTGIAMLAASTTSKGNIFWDLNVSGSGNDNMRVWWDNDFNVFNNITLSNSWVSGLFLRGSAFSGDGLAKMNVLTRLTIVNNTSSGIWIWDDGGDLSDLIFHNVTVAGNGANDSALYSQGAAAHRVTRTTWSQLAVSRNVNPNGGIIIEQNASTKFTGNLLVGNNTLANCSQDGQGTPGIDNSCNPTGSSDHNPVTTIDVSASFVQQATSDAANAAEDGAGEALGANISAAGLSNWYLFDSLFRNWGGDSGAAWPSNGLNSPCWNGSGTCQIWDWALRSAASVIRNTTGTGSSANGAFTAGAACPAEVAGTQFLTSQSYTYDSEYFSGYNGIETLGDSDGICEATETCVQRYLKNAVEILDDLIGDDDGLCETGETCLYTPNFGSYQGHGALGACTFTDGTITGVTMYGYPTNGY